MIYRGFVDFVLLDSFLRSYFNCTSYFCQFNWMKNWFLVPLNTEQEISRLLWKKRVRQSSIKASTQRLRRKSDSKTECRCSNKILNEINITYIINKSGFKFDFKIAWDIFSIKVYIWYREMRIHSKLNFLWWKLKLIKNFRNHIGLYRKLPAAKSVNSMVII